MQAGLSALLAPRLPHCAVVPHHNSVPDWYRAARTHSESPSGHKCAQHGVVCDEEHRRCDVHVLSHLEGAVQCASDAPQVTPCLCVLWSKGSFMSWRQGQDRRVVLTHKTMTSQPMRLVTGPALQLCTAGATHHVRHGFPQQGAEPNVDAHVRCTGAAEQLPAPSRRSKCCGMRKP